MASPAFFFVRRRENVRGPMLTPGEVNVWARQTDVTVHEFEERQHQSRIPCRPSRHWIAFFGPIPKWSAEDFLAGKDGIRRMPNTPRGRMSLQQDRRNVAIPDRVSYGSLVGENDGYSPNGLD
jgi:hypothetical protein